MQDVYTRGIMAQIIAQIFKCQYISAIRKGNQYNYVHPNAAYVYIKMPHLNIAVVPAAPRFFLLPS